MAKDEISGDDNAGIDPEVLEELKFRLLLLKYSEDDPVLEANMLENLKRVYREKGLKVPQNVEKVIAGVSKKLRIELEELIHKKKGELKKLLEKKRKEYEKLGKKEEFVSRTEEIFGDIYNTYEDAMSYLEKLQERGIRLGLDNIQKVLDMMGNPEKELRTILVAGTNGKGSVCAMIDSILQAAGYSVGRYISPHLTSFTERMTINSQEISEKEVVEFVNYIRPYLEKVKLTYFEAVTVVAFLYFRQKKVDFAVLEVGLGGRLDATNVVNPLISVITNVEIEHTEHLGKTVSEIAKEKAGIIRENGIVVTAAEGEAFDVINRACEQRDAKLVPLLKSRRSGDTIDMGSYTDIKLGLGGNFQVENAATAVTAITALREQNIAVPVSAVRNGLEFVEWPGRMEFHDNILLDCAHNPSGVVALKREVEKLKYEKLILVIGVVDGKDVKGMLERLAPMADMIIVTQADSNRAVPADNLAKDVSGYNDKYEIKKDVGSAIEAAKAVAGEKDLILVTGSCYVVGEALLAL